jgi:exo-beta-1,3-glucanase (GH17 family)
MNEYGHESGGVSRRLEGARSPKPPASNQFPVAHKAAIRRILARSDSLPMRRSLLLFALVAAAIGAFWYGMGRPIPMPPSPLAEGRKLNCVSYAPFHGEQGPFTPAFDVSDAEIEADLERLSPFTSCVRSYSAAKVQGKITKLAGRHNLKVLQGIWLGRNRADNRREIEAALTLARRYPGVIEAFIVGNEALLRGELSPADIKTYLEEVRRRGGLPVTYADVWEYWLKAPELADAVDFVTIHILPYWEDDPVSARDAVAHVREVRERMAQAFPGKEILIGEVGWPSAGRMRGPALPSPANQARVLSGVVAAAEATGWKLNLIEAYDQPWKRLIEGMTGGCWGLFDDGTRTQKFRWGAPVSDHPNWLLEGGLGVAAAFLVFLAGWLGSRGRPEQDAQIHLAIAAIALGAGIVIGWGVVTFPMVVPELGDRFRALALLTLALGVPVLAAFTLARGTPLPSLALALNPPLWRRAGHGNVLLAILLAALVVAAIHVALGLVFDPRYKDFPFAALTGPVAALAVLVLAIGDRRADLLPPTGAAETTIAALLAGSALFLTVNEGIANWQALWFASLLLVLSFTLRPTESVLRARSGRRARVRPRPVPVRTEAARD